MTSPTSLALDAVEQRATAFREQDKQLVTRLLALPPHAAARWLAKWLIETDVRRGYSEHEIVLGGKGAGGSLGDVSVIAGRKIEVRRIGPPANWVERYGYPAPGYDHQERFSLHRIYQEVRDELVAAKHPRQLGMWESSSDEY